MTHRRQQLVRISSLRVRIFCTIINIFLNRGLSHYNTKVWVLRSHSQLYPVHAVMIEILRRPISDCMLARMGREHLF